VLAPTASIGIGCSAIRRSLAALLSHPILFGYIYPAERTTIPSDVVQTLLRRQAAAMQDPSPVEQVCNGTVLSRTQYVVDVEQWGYHDARIRPLGQMTADEAAVWTEAGKAEAQPGEIPAASV
jgi:hypothetical protein